MSYAPVLLFVYNRPQHTRRAIESLKQNKPAGESPLVIYSDAPKRGRDNDAVNEVREYIHSVEGFASVTIIEQEENKGLAQSIIDGVTSQVNRSGKVIVLEDDLVVSPGFLTFMNEALDTYQDVEDVININGHLLKGKEPFPETFFLRFANSWGWGTWKRGWDYFEPDGKKLLAQLEEEKLTKEFDFNGAYHFTRMLREQTEGKNNSWAIRWNASIFLNRKLSLNTGKSLVTNEGFDGTGTHCNTYNLFETEIYTGLVNITKEDSPEEDVVSRAKLSRIYRHDNSYVNKIRVRLKNILKM